MKKFKQNRSWNSIALLLVVVVPAVLIFTVFDGQTLQQGFVFGTQEKLLLTLCFWVCVFLVGLLLLKKGKVTVFGFSLMQVLSVLLMLLYLFTSASFWVRVSVWVLTLSLALPLLLLFKKLGEWVL